MLYNYMQYSPSMFLCAYFVSITSAKEVVFMLRLLNAWFFYKQHYVKICGKILTKL